MTSLNFILTLLADPTVVIVSIAIVLLVGSTIRDWGRHHRSASDHRYHLLTNTLVHYRPNVRVDTSRLRKAS